VRELGRLSTPFAWAGIAVAARLEAINIRRGVTLDADFPRRWDHWHRFGSTWASKFAQRRGFGGFAWTRPIS
jgi:hypothetical protein